MPKATADVVICGAGPVGLIIALGLAQQGIDTLIVGQYSALHGQLNFSSLIGTTRAERTARARVLWPSLYSLSADIGTFRASGSC